MASGVGITGAPGRCYSLWVDFTKCLETAQVPIDCLDFREDYIECLHHRKEHARQRKIADEVRRQQQEKRDNGGTTDDGGGGAS